MLRIKAIKNGNTMYFKEPTKKRPVFTPIKALAAKFASLSLCKVMRDDCLEYVDHADIETVRS